MCAYLQHLQGLGSQVALWQYFCHCLLTPLSWLPCLTFSLSPGALQHPTFSRSPSFRSLQVCACRFSPVLDRCGHAYGVSSLSGLLVPWVGCLVLVSLEPVCACLQHPSRTGFPLPLVVAGVRCVAAPSVKLASFHGWLPGFGFFSRCALAGSTR